MKHPSSISTDTGGDGEVVPYISATQTLPEITLKALVLGFALSALLAGANAYLGLKVGLTVSASIPAAVISMAVLRMFRESNILENNIVQTSASAGESLAAGIIFTFPALILLQYWQEFRLPEMMIISLAGGVLGVMFTIPLRRALILEAKLKFPEGLATGEVLKAGSEGGRGARDIAVAGAAAALLKLCQSGFKVAAGQAHGAVTTGGAIFGLGSELGGALLGVGYIVGLNIAVLMFGGGLISWLVGIPIYSATVGAPEANSLFESAQAVWGSRIRYMGVGAMVVGGVWALISLVGPIRDGIRSSLAAVRESRTAGAVTVPRTERDTPINVVLFGTVALAVPILAVMAIVVDREVLAISGGLYWSTIAFGVLFSLTAGFLFASVAGYMAGLVGSSNNPISGVTIATILTVSLIFLAMLGGQIDFAVDTVRASAAASTAILVGAVVCCAAAIAGDNMQDLKAGQIVGATPMKQQIMQMVGVLAGALAVPPVLGLLFNAYGLGGVFPREGMDPAEMLTAPQATLMSAVANGVFARNLPWAIIGIGGAIAVAIIAADQVLKARGATFRMPVLAVAVGIYLPIELTTPIFIGGLVAHLAGRTLGRQREKLGQAFDEVALRAGRRGLLFAAGLITGEALVGIILAIPFAAAQNTDVLRLMPRGLEWMTTIVGLTAFVAFILWLHRVASR